MIQEKEGDPSENRILRFEPHRHPEKSVSLENERTLAEYANLSDNDGCFVLDVMVGRLDDYPTPPRHPSDESTIFSAFSIMATIGGRAHECAPLLSICRTMFHDGTLIRLTDAALFRLQYACYSSTLSVERVRVLLLPVSELAVSNMSVLDVAVTPALVNACQCWNEPVACEVMQHAPKDGRGLALVIAAALGLVDIIRCAVARGADATTTRHYSTHCPFELHWTKGISPLHAAVRSGQYAAVRVLLELGARADTTLLDIGVPPTSFGPHDFFNGGGLTSNAGTPLASALAPVSPFGSAGILAAVSTVPAKSILAIVDAAPAGDALTALFWTCRYLEDPLILVALLERVQFTLPQLWAAAMHAASAHVLDALLRQCRILAAQAMCLLDVNTHVDIPLNCVPACSGWRALTTTDSGSTLLDRLLDRAPFVPGALQLLLDNGAVPTRSTLMRATMYGCVALLPSMLSKCPERARFASERRYDFTLLERVCWLLARSSSPLHVPPAFLASHLQRSLQLDLLPLYTHWFEKQDDAGAATDLLAGNELRSYIPRVADVEASVYSLLALGAVPTPFALCGAFQSHLPLSVIVAMFDVCHGSLHDTLHAACDLSRIAVLPTPATVDIHTNSALDVALRINVEGYYPELLRRRVILSVAQVCCAFINTPLRILQRIAEDYKDVVQHNATAILDDVCRLLPRTWFIGSFWGHHYDNLHGEASPDLELTKKALLLLSMTVGNVASADALHSAAHIIQRENRLRNACYRVVCDGMRLCRVQLLRALLTRGAGASINDGLPRESDQACCDVHGDVPASLFDRACCSGLFDEAHMLLELGATPSSSALYCAVRWWGRGDFRTLRVLGRLCVPAFIDSMLSASAAGGGDLDLSMIGPTGLTLLEAVLEPYPYCRWKSCCNGGPGIAVPYLLFARVRVTRKALFIGGVLREWACHRHQFMPDLVARWVVTSMYANTGSAAARRHVTVPGAAWPLVTGPGAAGPGASLDFYDTDGVSLLYHAAAAGREEFCSLLLKFGAHAGIPNTDGSSSTPLHVAAAGRHGHVVVELMSHGADPLAKDANGLPPDLTWMPRWDGKRGAFVEYTCVANFQE